jgi:NADP-dependent 3-hydroxy acid dehydrogenase YdfG
MKKTILICGHGPGISDAVARKFGADGFAVALAARSADKLDAAVKALGAKGITAAAFPTDLGNPQAVKQLVSSVHAKLGPLNVLHWNVYAFGAGDIAADPAELQNSLNVSTTGLWTAVQAAHGDLKEQKGAVLVTGGALCFYDPKVDAMAVEYGALGLAVSKAAQHKLTGLLSVRLGKEGIYVGEVVVTGAVKGTVSDQGNATIEAGAVAEKFWALYQARSEHSTTI